MKKVVPLKEGSKGNLGSLSRLFSLVVEHYTCNVKVSSSILEASLLCVIGVVVTWIPSKDQLRIRFPHDANVIPIKWNMKYLRQITKNLCYLSTKNGDANIYEREIETNSGIVVDDREVIVYG